MYTVVFPVCEIADVAFVVDGSGSISDPPDGSPGKWDYHLSFAASVVSKLPVSATGTHVGLVTFGNTGQVVFDLARYTNSANSAIRNAILGSIYPGGLSNTSGGLWVAQAQLFSRRPGDRQAVPNIIVVLTDGRATRDGRLTADIVQQIQNSGVRMFAVGITNFMNEDKLRSLASPPRRRNKNYFMADGVSQLNGFVDSLVSEICFPENSSITTQSK